MSTTSDDSLFAGGAHARITNKAKVKVGASLKSIMLVYRFIVTDKIDEKINI